jgi:hypothetical protein
MCVKISGFGRCIVQILAPNGVLCEWVNGRLPKFRDTLSVPSLTDKHPSTLDDGSDKIYRNVGNQP